MGRIDNYIHTFKRCGIQLKERKRRSATFTFGPDIVFTGYVNLKGEFAITNFQGSEEFNEIVDKVNLAHRLRNSNLITDEAVISLTEDLILGDYSSYTKALIESRSKLVFNLSSGQSSRTKSISNLKFLLVVLPKPSRQEFISDIQSIIEEMKSNHCRRAYVWFVVLIHFVSVVYHAFFFKLKGYFYPGMQASKDKEE